MKFSPNLSTVTGREIKEMAFDSEAIVTSGSNFMIGNGYMGYRGTFMEDTKDAFVACIVTDTYDNADGKWRELCNVPNGLYATLSANGIPQKANEQSESYEKMLNLEKGIFSRTSETAFGRIETEKFASMTDNHGLIMRVTYTPYSNQIVELDSGIDGDVWSINGEHFSRISGEETEGVRRMIAVTQEDGIEICVSEKTVFPKALSRLEKETGNKAATLIEKSKAVIERKTFKISSGEPFVFYKYVAIFTSNDTKYPKQAGAAQIARFESEGYESLKARHIDAWEKLWDAYFIEVQADLETQAAVLFNLYHNIIHTPTHALLPIGARGLSCQAYQGAAFWDQEIYNLPMYLYTNPEIARHILEYRYATLEGARKKAKDLGFRGAFYAWVSGDTGEELCPDFFFKDVISGRRIRNHFNDWQIHISPDIAYTVLKYLDVTGDMAFIADQGYEILADVCLFLKSRTHFNPEKQRYEFIRLLGPDEYHENVDNNVFTNYQAKYVIERTLALMEHLRGEKPGRVEVIHTAIGMTDQDLAVLKDMKTRLYVPKPDPHTKRIEQFDGYFKLEHRSPESLKADLKHPLEYWGWPNGVAVHTQVIKQADVIQLFVQHPDFGDDVLKANYAYYEPLTEHGSSLSPAMHAIVAARIDHLSEAEKYFEKACLIDLNNSNKAVSGGTFIGGIHTAAAGAVWQIIVFGLAGFKYEADTVYLSPKCLDNWKSYQFALSIRGHRVVCHIEPEQIHIESFGDESLQTTVSVSGETRLLTGNEKQTFLL